MKKIISLILVFAMLMSTVVFADGTSPIGVPEDTLIKEKISLVHLP